MSYEMGPGIEPDKSSWSYLKYIIGIGLIAVVVHWFITDIDNISKNVGGFWRHWTKTETTAEFVRRLRDAEITLEKQYEGQVESLRKQIRDLKDAGVLVEELHNAKVFGISR